MIETATWWDLVGDLARSAAVLVLFVAAGAALFRSRWQQAPYLAPVYGLLTLGVVGGLSFAGWLLSPLAGRMLAHTAAALAVAVLVVAARRRRRDPLRIPDDRGDVLIALLLTLAAAGVIVGLLMLWSHGDQLFPLARARWLGRLPIDNELPSAVANAMYEGIDPRESVAGWQSSDRPQLQSGLLLLVDALVDHRAASGATLHFATGMLVQLSWVPGAYAFARSLRLRPFAAGVGVLMAVMSGSLLVNSVYTWPKLLSAGLMLGGMAVLVEASRRHARATGPFVTLGLAIALSFLSHGAALFALPIVAVVVLVLCRSLWSPRSVAMGMGAAALLYAPWLAYQQFYDPPGDRLLKWHLAGVVEATETSLGDSIRSAYGSLSWHEIWALKWSNLTFPWTRSPLAGLSSGGVDVRSRTSSEFMYLGPALGLALLLVVALALVLVVRALASQVRRRAAQPLEPIQGSVERSVERRVALLMAACAAAVLFWALLMFGPDSTSIHQGTHLVIILPLMLPIAWVASRWRWIALVVLALQATLFLKTYAPLLGATDMNLRALATLLAGLTVASALLVVLARREAPQAQPVAAQERVVADELVGAVTGHAEERTAALFGTTAPVVPAPRSPATVEMPAIPRLQRDAAGQDSLQTQPQLTRVGG